MTEEISQFNSSLKELLNADSLFRWELHTFDENRYEEDLYRADSFFRVVAELLKIHQKYKEKDYSATLELVEKLQKTIEDIENDTLSVLRQISRALDHIIQISKTTILLHCGNTKKCFETLGNMPSRKVLNHVDEAAILAIRSACCTLYSYNGLRDAHTFIERAIQKDPKPFWRFLKAVFLYKSRSALNHTDPPSLEEIEILKKVNEEEKDNPLFMVYLADVYRESAKSNENKKELDFWFIPPETRNSLKMETENMFKGAKTLYENAFKLRSQCPFVAFRCANGLMKLPQKYQNVKVAKEIITGFGDAIQNSGYGNTTAAFYHHQFGKKPDVARNYLEAAMKLNAFNAHIINVKLTYKEDPKAFKIDILKKMLDTFQEAPKKKIIHAQLISYYLFRKQDLKLACEYLMEYLKIGGPRNSLERHVSCFLDVVKPFPLVDVVVDQVKFTLNNPKATKETREFYDRFIHSSHFYNLNLDWRSKPQNLKNQILDNILPEMKSKTLPELRSSTNPRYGANKGPNQPGNTRKTQNRQPGRPNVPPRNPQYPNNRPGQSNVPPKNPQYPNNKPGPSNSETRFSKQTPNQNSASNLQKKPAPDSNVNSGKRELPTEVDRDKKDACEREEQAGRDEKDSHGHEERRHRRSRHSSASSQYSDHERHRRDKKKHHHHHHRRRRSSTSSSESDSPHRRPPSPSHSRRHRRRSKEYRKRHDGRRRHSTSSDSSSSSYDRRYKSTSSSESDSPHRRPPSPSHSRRHRRRSKEYRKRHDGRRRHSTSSDSSSSSYDRRYKEKGRKYDRRRSHSVSDTSSLERYEKKKHNRHVRERNPRSRVDEGNSHLRKKMTEMTLDDQSSRSRKTEATNRQK